MALLDSKGKIAENYRYTAFGETEVFSNTSLNNPWRYSSKRFDAETGFYYFGHRYYDPEIGRWTTPDPAGFADGPNLYTYAHNHPLAYIDPDGRLAWLLIPMAISLAAEYCLPAAVMCLEPYLCTEAAGFLTGLVNGFNTNFFETGAAKAAGYHNVGMAIGGALNLIPGKAASNVVSKGSQLVTHVAAKELSGAATNALATKVSKWFSWFKPSAAPVGQSIQKTAQVAERHLAKDGIKSSEYAFKRGAGRHLFEEIQTGKNMGLLERPYMRSPLTIREIISTGKGVPDATAKGALNFKVPGTFRNSPGTWELVVDAEKNIIYHYLFRRN